MLGPDLGCRFHYKIAREIAHSGQMPESFLSFFALFSFFFSSLSLFSSFLPRFSFSSFVVLSSQKNQETPAAFLKIIHIIFVSICFAVYLKSRPDTMVNISFS